MVSKSSKSKKSKKKKNNSSNLSYPFNKKFVDEMREQLQSSNIVNSNEIKASIPQIKKTYKLSISTGVYFDASDRTNTDKIFCCTGMTVDVSLKNNPAMTDHFVKVYDALHAGLYYISDSFNVKEIKLISSNELNASYVFNPPLEFKRNAVAITAGDGTNTLSAGDFCKVDLYGYELDIES